MSAQPLPSHPPVPARIDHRPVISGRGRLLGPLMRVSVRPLLTLTPLTTWTLARLYLFDLFGAFLRLPPGATAVHRHFGEFDAEQVTGNGVSINQNRVILFFHGGGFISCGLRTHRRLVARISTAAGVPVLHVNYRQLPDVTLTQTVEDCAYVYRQLLAQGYPGGNIVLAGDSAGGYLAFATALRALQEGLSRPAAIVALSPWLDLECRHSSMHHNARRDAYIPVKKLAQIAGLLGATGITSADVLSGDVSGLPPVFIQVGSTEVLLSDAEMATSRLAAAGVPCQLQIWDRQVHVFQAAADAVPEAAAAITEIGEFVRAHTGPVADSRHQENR